MVSRFEGLEDIVFPEAKGHYEPGGTGEEMELSKQLMELWSKETLRFGAVNSTMFVYDFVRKFNRGVAAITDIIEGHEYEPQALINTMTYRLHDVNLSKSTNIVSESLGHFLNALVQSLYNLGHNGFIVDTRHFNITPKDMGKWLVGKVENEFELTMLGNVTSIGTKVRHCKISHYGEALYTGKDAHQSKFHLSGTHERVGSGAYLSVFHGVDSMLDIFGMHKEYRDTHAERIPYQCIFLAQEKGNEAMGLFERIGFWYSKNRLVGTFGNTIFLPDGSGGLKKVKK